MCGHGATRTEEIDMGHPEVIWETCTGPNIHCRRAYRDGRPVHIIPAHDANMPHLVLATNHYATVGEAKAMVAFAEANAQLITTDEELYAARDAGRSYFLPVGWVDPSRRR
jgi:hypothetical protein